MIRWPTGKDVFVAAAVVALAIAWTAAVFPGVLPDYIPDECKPSETARARCTILYVALSPVFRAVSVVGSIENLAVVLTAAFTGALFWSTYRLWRANERQIAIARASAEALPKMERAYLFLGPSMSAGIVWRPDGGARVYIDFSFKNFGRTPAIVFEILASFQFCPSGCPDDGTAEPYIGGAVPVGLALGGGDVVEDSKSMILSKEELERACDGDGAIIFWGQIAYLDVFERKWRTGFGREIQLFRDTSKSPRVRMTHCPGMNTYS